MSLAVQKAIVARVRGEEALTDTAEAAQVELAGYLAQTANGNVAIRYGAKGSSAVYPEVTFRENGGSEALGGVDVGICAWNLYNFEIWDDSGSGVLIPEIADCLERLLDCRRGAPVLPVASPNVAWWGELSTHLQAPFHDDNINAYFGILAFQFAEARP